MRLEELEMNSLGHVHRIFCAGLSKWCFALLGVVLAGTALAAQPVIVGVTGDDPLAKLGKVFKDANGCENIKSYDFSAQSFGRSYIEIILSCQALKLGGYAGEFKMVNTENYNRTIAQAAEGKVTMPSSTLWSEDLDEKLFYKTKPLLADGEIVAGVFVLSSKLKSYNVKTKEDLKKLKGVTDKNWVKDWATMTAIGGEVIDAPNMTLMIQGGRADYTFTTFNSSPTLEVEWDGVTLAPLPGVKVYLHGERSLAVSRAAPNGKEVFDALNKGIETMRKNGTINRAWRESGFINKRTASWTALN